MTEEKQQQIIDYQQLSELIHRRKLSQEQREEYIKALYDQFGTIRKAAKQIDVSPSVIVRYCQAWKKRREETQVKNQPT